MTGSSLTSLNQSGLFKVAVKHDKEGRRCWLNEDSGDVKEKKTVMATYWFSGLEVDDPTSDNK